MKKSEIIWQSEGWTSIQDADAEKHLLGISCLAENGVVVEVRKRHNDGEEEKLTKKLEGDYSLPMALADFRKAVEEGKLTLK